MGTNFLTDWTAEEIDKRLGGGYQKTFLTEQQSTFKRDESMQVADSIDWRSKGAVN